MTDPHDASVDPASGPPAEGAPTGGPPPPAEGGPTGGPPPAGATAGATRQERELLREWVTMALYISLSLLAVVLAVPSSGHGPSAWTVFLTALGLVAAHLLAFSISARYVNDGELDEESAKLLGVQTSAGLGVAVLATLPVLLLPEPAGVDVTGALLVLVIGVVGYLTARNAGRSRLRAIGYVVIVALVALVVLLIKSLVH